MKKKLIFCICILLSIIMGLSSMPFSAYSYECSVDVTSAAVMIANVETDTVVYEKNIDTAHYMSYLSNLMTFIVAYTNTADINERIEITAEMINSIPNSDGTLDKYIDHTLTIKDLLYFIMMTNGNDACYILADYVSKGDVDAFVELMNKKARDLGCTKTKFSSPAGRNSATQFTTCSDLYKIVKCALDIPEYNKIASASTYMPDKYVNEKLTVTTNNSLLNKKSPYYFKHVKNGKYGADLTAKGNLVAVSKYSDVTYVCVILGSQLLSEHNAFTETKQLLTWAYTTLGNKKIIDSDDVLATVTASSAWGESEINLTTSSDVIKTVPAEFDSSLLEFEYNGTKSVELPVFKGQNMGTANILYNGKLFDETDLVSNSSDGVSMLEDLESFLGSMYKATIIQTESTGEDFAADTDVESEATPNQKATEKKGQ